MDWLFSSIDPGRVHDISFEISWHARLMVLAWSFLIPVGIISARFFKITPRQNWPEERDNKFWWYGHLICQYSAGVLILISLWMIWDADPQSGTAVWHVRLGWVTIVLCASQYVAGWLRGTKGGPTEVERTGTIRGDHYDMTKRRKIFEHFHKMTGYAALSLAIIVTFGGLWFVNAPIWMFLSIILWWVVIVLVFVRLQKKGSAYDTYEAIWGDDPTLPGNKIKPIGWGIKRMGKDS